MKKAASRLLFVFLMVAFVGGVSAVIVALSRDRVVIPMKISAYCPCKQCCGEHANGLTAIGDDARVCDGVAADPRLIPYRTKLSIPGVGIREVDDTGGRMRRDGEHDVYHIDLRFASHEEAVQWGVRELDVTVLRSE